MEAADATIGRTEVSAIILGNTVYLRNENASAGKACRVHLLVLSSLHFMYVCNVLYLV